MRHDCLRERETGRSPFAELDPNKSHPFFFFPARTVEFGATYKLKQYDGQKFKRLEAKNATLTTRFFGLHQPKEKMQKKKKGEFRF